MIAANEISELDRRLAGLNQTREECLYYAMTLTADDDLNMTLGLQTQWVGWEDKDRRVELRKARLVYPNFAELWRNLGQPYSVIHNPDEMMLFWIGGGNALVEKDLADATITDLLKPGPSYRDGLSGFKDHALCHSGAFRHAPTPKLRMQILNRDDRRCRVCGRRPDDDVDLELHVHHIRPWSKGGLTEASNLITLCHTCHRGLDPHEDHSLFGYIPPFNVSNPWEIALKELLEGIRNYRRIALTDEL